MGKRSPEKITFGVGYFVLPQIPQKSSSCPDIPAIFAGHPDYVRGGADPYPIVRRTDHMMSYDTYSYYLYGYIFMTFHLSFFISQKEK